MKNILKKKNKKGLLIELIVLIVVGFAVLIFFAAWQYGHNLITLELLNMTSETEGNVSEAAGQTITYVNSGMDFLKIIAFTIIFGFAIGTIIAAFFTRDHPILILAYILVVIVLVIFSIYVSNNYNTLLDDEILGSKLSEYGIANNFMQYLPIWITVIGLTGIIVMFVGVMKGREFEY